MSGFFSKMKDKFSKPGFEEDMIEASDNTTDYVELDSNAKESSQKIIVRPFVLEDFSDIKPVLDSLREGNTICLVNIKPLKDKDLVELKRAINKLKKTTDAIEGDIAGFSDDYIVIAPGFAEIYRAKPTSGQQEQPKTQVADDDLE
jgi:SepF-like predicted cell division protein (DUF552 family)